MHSVLRITWGAVLCLRCCAQICQNDNDGDDDDEEEEKDGIETREGKPSVIDSSDKVQRELRRMKVVNNRDNVFDDKPVDMHFVNQLWFGILW